MSSILGVMIRYCSQHISNTLRPFNNVIWFGNLILLCQMVLLKIYKLYYLKTQVLFIMYATVKSAALVAKRNTLCATRAAG